MFNITEAELIQIEINRLKTEQERLTNKLKFLNNEKLQEGYVYDDNFDIILDKSNLTQEHPEFIKAWQNQGLNNSYKNEYFEIWKKHQLDQKMNSLFKSVFFGKIINLIPENVKLLQKLK